MRVVGLTGGIACGKSTCSTLLQQAGIPVIDCDLLARDVVQRGRWGYHRVVKAFGSSILMESGDINRETLGEIVFSNPAARRRLNAATHLPVLFAILQQLLKYWVTCAPAVVVDMPLLFETGFYHVTRPRILVACEPQVQRARLMQRDKMLQAVANARIASQMPLDAKRRLADIVIENNGSLEELQTAARAVAVELQKGRGAWLHRWVLSPVGAAAALAAAALLTFGREVVTGS